VNNLSDMCKRRRRAFSMSLARCHGFTLIELMIVVAIIGILLMIAVPTYQNFMFRARRVEGKNLLQQIAAAEERYYTNNNKYTADMSAAGLGVSTVAATVTSPKGYYQLGVVLANGSLSYTFSAVPLGGQSGDLCGNLTLTNTGVKGPTAAAANGNGTCL